MSVPLSLDNRVALVTGGSRGIGAAILRRFVQAGAKIVFNYQRAQDAAAKLVSECGAERCHAVACDLTGTETARSLVDAAVARFGRLDILVANHGVWPAEDVGVEDMSDAQWRNTLAVNLDSVFALIKHAVAQMKRQPRRGFATGHIVLIASTSGQRGEAFHLDYSASKGALISMTKTLSSELIRSGIYVNSVAPGWVETDMVTPALNKPEVQQEILRAIPIGRVGRPDEIAGPVLFLCTEHAGFISGEIFNVNGGAVLIG
jgi:3-oxoacyl-[acyl-carrier protein] reductase